MKNGVKRHHSKDDAATLKTGDVPTASTTTASMTQDTGLTMNASGDLNTLQIMFESNGSVKPVRGTSTDSTAIHCTPLEKENVVSTTTKADKPKKELDIIHEI